MRPEHGPAMHTRSGAALDIDLVAGALRRHMHYDYNAAGQVATITLPGNLRTAFKYDQAGQLSKTILPDGSGIMTARDTEGRTERSARYLDAESDVSANLPDIRLAYDRRADQPGRLTQVSDALGLIGKYRYNDVGQVAAITNALGIASKFAYGADGRLSGRTDAADSADAATVGMAYDNAGHATTIIAANGVTTTRRYDDFGQKVMEVDPDHGVTLFRYDAAGRMVARIDETLVATRFSFDHANRLLAVGADKQPNLTRYQYRGRQLVRVLSTPDGMPEHATERTEYQRDALGKVVKETRWLASVTPPGAGAAASPGVSFVTTSDYDDAGRLVRQTLPDGHRLQYRYAPAGDDAGSHPGHRPGQLEAILFDDRIVVTDIEQTIAGGMTGYTMGNGMRQQISLDRRSRIEQLQVLPGSQDGWWNRLKAWFSAARSGETVLYKQVNHYDEGSRLVRIDRQSHSTQSGNAIDGRRERYAYDGMNRLTTLPGNEGTDTTISYDKGGNRIGEAPASSPTGLMRATSPRAEAAGRTYHYAPGSNRLLAVTQGTPAGDVGGVKSPTISPISTAPKSPVEVEQMLRSAWFYHPTGVQLAQLRWMNGDGAANRRIVYNSAKRPIAVYDNDQLIARYHYNSRGERIAKTVYPVRPAFTKVAHTQAEAQGDTTYSLYRDQRLAAETDGAGRITAHYIYLYGKPVAKIEMAANDSSAHRLWKAVTMRSSPNASDTLASIYAIVTDHLGTPQEVLDERQQVVWQAETTAFGQVRVLHAAATGANTKPFVMNLRMPGQVFDAETKLNYNYLRDYDPEIGRYTTPDPAGLGGGFNPYAYVSNNPLTNVDPLGLYQIDVHYYMTFFLAITAGVDQNTARRIALATQYIDDNPVTEPMIGPGRIDSGLVNQQALERYHFVQAGFDDPQRKSESDADYAVRRIENPNSPQLSRLLAASNFAKTDRNATCDSSAQLFGEYLHAFEDTFAHRNKDNDTYSATTLGAGTGHFIGGENPDYTYNHFSFGVLGFGYWNTNEARTLEMEMEMFEKMKTFSNPANRQETTIATIKYTLDSFNRFQANASSTNFADKIAILDKGLRDLGYSGINMALKDGADNYNQEKAASNRAESLNRLDPTNYAGTILPRSVPEPKK